MTILLVEDNPADEALALHALDGHVRNQIVVVRDGVEARDYLLGECADQVHLVLLDLNLPRISGLDVLREIRDRGSRVPVVILTSFRGDMDMVEGLLGGANSYLVKPIAFDKLAVAVRRLGLGWMLVPTEAAIPAKADGYNN